MRALRRRSSSRRGTALALALGALSVAAVAALLIASHTRELVDAGALTRAALVSRASADGGVEYARWALSRDPEFRGAERVIGAAAVSVRVARVAGRADERQVEIRTEQTSRGQPYRTRLDVRLRLADGLPAVVGWRER